MLVFLAILIALFPNGVQNSGFNFFRPKGVRVDRLAGRCPEYPHAVITMDNIKLIKIKRVYTLSTKITVRDNIINDFKLQVIGSRCKNKDSPDTCEQYQTVNVRRMCDLVGSGNHPWSPFVNQIKPKMNCPVKKGIYHVVNGTFDGNAFAALPIEDWYWKVKATNTEDVTNRVIMCVYMEAQIVPV